jgi:hypothetical protein
MTEYRNLQDLIDTYTRDMYGTSRETCKKTQLCVKCKKDATVFKDQISEKEYNLSGWCQDCQDFFFGK